MPTNREAQGEVELTCAVCGDPAVNDAPLGGWICGKAHGPEDVEQAIRKAERLRAQTQEPDHG